MKHREFRESVASQFVAAEPGKLVEMEYAEANHLNTFGGHFSKKPAISIELNPTLKYVILALYVTLTLTAGVAIFAALVTNLDMGTHSLVLTVLLINIVILLLWGTGKIIMRVTTRHNYQVLARHSDPPVQVWNGEAGHRYSTTYMALEDQKTKLSHDGASGFFLGHAPQVTPPSIDGQSCVMIDFSLKSGLYRKGEPNPKIDDHPLQWVPQPELSINGLRLPASWGVWFCRLSPGYNLIKSSLALPNGANEFFSASMTHAPHYDPDQF